MKTRNIWRHLGFGIIEHYVKHFDGEQIYEVVPPDCETFGGYFASKDEAMAAIERMASQSDEVLGTHE